MKITLNRKWRIGGWTQVATAAIGAVVDAAAKGSKVGTEVQGEGVVGQTQPGFMDLLRKQTGAQSNIGAVGTTVYDLNREGGHVAPRPQIDDQTWARLLMGQQ